MSFILVRVSVDVLKHQLGAEKVFANISAVSEEVRAGIQGRNLEAGLDVQVMEEYCLLVCSLRLV